MEEKSYAAFGEESGASDVTEVARAALDQRYKTVALEQKVCRNLVGRNHLNSSLSEPFQLAGVHKLHLVAAEILIVQALEPLL